MGLLIRRAPLFASLALLLGAGAIAVRADVVPTPLPVPSMLPTVAVPTLPAVLPSASAPTVASPGVSPPAGVPVSSPPVGDPVSSPAPVPVASAAVPASPRSVGRGAPAGTVPATAATPAVALLGPVGGAPAALRDVLDSPLGPAPPIAGLLLLGLSAALALRRRLRQMEHDRVLEEAKTGFLKVASHELRTPLTVIGGYVAMAADGSLGELPPRLKSVLPTVSSEVSQLERLVEQMLMAARIDEQLMVIDWRRVDLREVADECLRGLPDAPDHRVVLETDSVPVPVRGDAARLREVLANLVDNAIKYSPAGGEVLVRVERGWRHARLSVRDSGVGIPASDVPLLFTRFGRIVTPENSHIFGSGLGLYLVRELARLHGGQVRATSSVGRGSTFSVELPLDLPLWRRLLPARHHARRATPAAG